MASFPNVYTHRKVADTSAKSCDICFKSCTSVLVTPDKKDFFYVCPAHLKQSNFCKPVIDQAAVEAKKKKEIEEEVARVKREYEDRQRKKKEKEEADRSKEKEKDKDKDKDKEKDEKKGSDEKKPDSEKPDASADAKVEERLKEEEEPRVFELHRTFYQGRLEKKRQAEIDKRNRERLMNPATFPSVPKGLP